MSRLLQAIGDLGDARLGTSLVLIATRRAAGADAADDFVADFDWHTAPAIIWSASNCPLVCFITS